MSFPRIAFAGAAHSHAFADAANLRARGAVLSGVWEPDDSARRDEFADRFDVPAFDELDDLLALRPDLVVATPRTPRVTATFDACARRMVPVFFNKTIVAHGDALDEVDAGAVAGAQVATSSVLRFSPAVTALRDELATTKVRAIDVLAQHDITAFLEPGRRWQDDPEQGGGTLVSIGVHAVDLVDALLTMPASVPVLAGVTPSYAWTTAGDRPTRSEVLGHIVAVTRDGVHVSLTVSGVPGPDRYAVRVLTDTGIRTLSLGDDDDLGYDGLADALVGFAVGRPPVEWRRSAAGYRFLLAATRGVRPIRVVS